MSEELTNQLAEANKREQIEKRRRMAERIRAESKNIAKVTEAAEKRRQQFKKRQLVKAVYDLETGRIVGADKGTLVDPSYDERRQGFICEEGINPDCHYIDNGQVTLKTEHRFTFDKIQIIADGNDTATITDIPKGTRVRWPDGSKTVINDGRLSFKTDTPGVYKFCIDSARFFIEKPKIEAV